MIKNDRVMSLKDIEKLKERVEKDPNSKLFVPLAEEYRKEGMLDEAINVLLSGLDRQPGYMSARVSLGKIYLEKGMMNEARSEFENVIKSIPDNLYAHKKLAEIYRDTGHKDLSIRSYRTVLKLNALDEDALSTLRELEGVEELPAEETPAAVGVEDVLTDNQAVYEDDVVETITEEISVPEVAQEIPAAIADSELDAFKDSLFGGKGNVEGEPAHTERPGEEEAIALVEEEPSEADEISFDDVNEALEEETPSLDEISAAFQEEVVAQDVKEIQAKASPVPPPDKGTGLEDADRFIAEGNYGGAINIYRTALSANPSNNAVRQRMEDLKVLLKLMGKDKEALIERLNAFLEGIQKRRDEFHGSS